MTTKVTSSSFLILLFHLGIQNKPRFLINEYNKILKVKSHLVKENKQFVPLNKEHYKGNRWIFFHK